MTSHVKKLLVTIKDILTNELITNLSNVHFPYTDTYFMIQNGLFE